MYANNYLCIHVTYANLFLYLLLSSYIVKNEVERNIPTTLMKISLNFRMLFGNHYVINLYEHIIAKYSLSIAFIIASVTGRN